MDRWKYRRIFTLFLVILIINFIKIIIINENNIKIINFSIFPYSAINDNEYFEGFDIFNSFDVRNSVLVNLGDFTIPIIINNSNLGYKKTKAIIIYKNDFEKINIGNQVINSQYKNIKNIKNIISFFNEYNLILPNELYIYDLNYNQSFFLPSNNFFLKKKDILNGVIIHELSHYTFGYVIKKENVDDIWPEIICEAIRLKYLSEFDNELYIELLDKKKKDNNVYSKILNYPKLLNNLSIVIKELLKYEIISDKDFNNIYNSFGRGVSN